MSSAEQFTIKATYATTSVTRKFSFAHASFPSYDELHQQLFRVFSHGQEYYLSRLIFSPVPGTSILIGMEVHNQEQYDRYVGAHQGVYPGGVFKFTVHDKLPHKRLRTITSTPALLDRLDRATALLSDRDIPNRATLLKRLQARSVAAARAGQPSSSVASSPAPFSTPIPSRPVSLYNPAYIPPLPVMPSAPTPPAVPTPPTVPAPPPPMNFSAIPPPPIIFSTTPTPMSAPVPMLTPPPAPPSRPQSYISTSSSCCSVEDKKEEVKELLSNFLRDFGELTSSTFGVPTSELTTPVRTPAIPETPPAKPPKPWLNISEQSLVSNENGSASSSSDTSSMVHPGIRCDGCFKTLRGVRNKCTSCPDFDLCTPCLTTPAIRDAHRAGHAFCKISAPQAAVHQGVLCDSCNNTIVGIRHKCLDCTGAGFDLCTACREGGALERLAHDPFHEFLPISEPGRVIVHNVYSGVGQAASPTTSRTAQTGIPDPNAASAPVPVSVSVPDHSRRSSQQSVTHHALCDLCDSRIEGVRFKCLVCPDFDTCSSCFKITREQHPAHGFVRVHNPSDLKLRGMVRARESVRHMASCDMCRKTIYGVRFKCMHPDCPDYDLCADCEAHPIPQHPVDHPLLKMKTATTVIPTVYRVGGTMLIPEPPQPISRASSSAQTPVMRSVQIEEPAVVSSEDQKSVSEIGNLSKQFSHLLEEERLVDVDVAPAPIAAPAAASPLGNEALLSTPNVQSQGAPNGDYVSLLRRLQENLQPNSSTSVPSPELMSETFKPVLRWVTDTRELLSSAAASASAAAEQRRTATIVEPVQMSPMPGAMPGEVSPISFAPAPLPEVTDVGLSVAPWSTWLEPQSAVTTSTEPFIRPESPFVESPFTEAPSTIATDIIVPTVAAELEEEPKIEATQAEESKPVEVSAPASPAPLRTAFVSDLNIPDGQVFPPGAEFVKSWVLRNNGERAWPEDTQLGFVAGERMGAASRISIGAVAPGTEVTVSTPEMKAPDVEGRYVSYWRLFEAEGGPAFGTSVWVDVTVTETIAENDSGASLASSSIIMPGPSSAAGITTTRGAGSFTTASDDDDVLSVASSMSLIDAPSEVGSERPATARSNVNDGEFVVLYDTAESDED